MTPALAAGEAPEVLVAVAAAVAAGAALVLADRRRRAMAILAAGALAALALGSLVAADVAAVAGRRPALAGVAALAALAGLAALVAVLRRRPGALVLLAAAVLPFRVPVPTGDDTANLLVPLYAVIGAGCIAAALSGLRRDRGAEPAADAADPARPLRWALAAVLVLYALQALYSTDARQAIETLCFFYVPFALLLALLLDVRWTPRVLRRTFAVVAGLAVVFAVVGIVEYATGHLLIANAKVLEANELKPYFRVNSLFFDPNIYGRFLAVAMAGLATVLLWSRKPSTAVGIAAALVVLWAGLLFSLSQSSFGALLTALAVLAAIRWRRGPVLAAVGLAVAVSVAVIALAPGTVGLGDGSERALDRATSGRVDLLQGGLRMVGDRPLTGFGSGSFAERFRVREGVRSKEDAAISHTTPLTIAAEQGAIGLLAYLVLLVTASACLLRGLGSGLRDREPPIEALARVAVAAAFCGLVLHTFAYAAFLEDPLTWLLLGAGAVLARTRPAAAPAGAGAATPVAAPARPAPSTPAPARLA